MRPPKRIIICEEVKIFTKNNRHPKEKLHRILVGRKEKGVWYVEGLFEAYYESVCPTNSKPFGIIKASMSKRGHVLGLIHSHPREACIPSTHDLRKAPVNKIHIIMGADKPTAWFKHKNSLIEVELEHEE